MATHEGFMEKALCYARDALREGEFPVGCVLVSGGEIVACGRRRKSMQNNEMEHAEIIALRELYARFPAGLPPDLLIYSTMEPCLMCFSTLILNGVRTIVYGYEDIMGGACSLDLSTLAPLYRDMTVSVVPSVQRQRCLALFQQFFRTTDSAYLAGSLLCDHTLAQQVGMDEGECAVEGVG